MDFTEQTPIEQIEPMEVADMESDRVRQSELVNMSTIQLGYKLESLDLLHVADGLCDSTGRPVNFSCLPPELAEALLLYLNEYEADMQKASQNSELLRAQREKDEARLEVLSEKLDRTKSTVAFYSDQSSADLQTYRQTLQLHATQNKQRNREIADVVRKRERVELELRRTDMEIDRLRKIQKSVR